MRITRFVPSREKMVVSAMSCPKCGWKETLELSNCEMEVITLDDEPYRGPRSVTELPKHCPNCGDKLKKEKLPIRIIN